MAENSKEVVDALTQIIDGSGASGYVAVGFRSGTGLQELDKLLKKYFGKPSIDLDTLVKNDTERKRNEEKQQASDNNKHKELLKKLDEVKDTVSKKSDEDGQSLNNRLQELYSQAARVAKIGINAYIEMRNAATPFVATMRNLESSGVSLSNGMKDIADISAQTGMSIDDIGTNFSKASGVISKFNAVGQNGIQSLTNMYKSIDDKLNLTFSEQTNLINEFIDQRKNLHNLNDPNFQQEFTKYATNIKLLARATGTTVENLIQEQKEKEKARSLQAYAMSNPGVYQGLKAIGASDDMILNIMSGGRLSAAETLMARQNPLLNTIYMTAMQGMRNGTLNINNPLGILGAISSIRPVYNNEMNRVATLSSNPDAVTVAGVSSLMDLSLFGSMDVMSNKFLNTLAQSPELTNKLVQYYKTGDKSIFSEGDKWLTDYIDEQKERNKFDTRLQYMKAGGVEGSSLLTNASSEVLHQINNGTDYIIKIYDWLNDQTNGFMGVFGLAFGSSVLTWMASNTVKAIGDLAGIKFLKDLGSEVGSESGGKKTSILGRLIQAAGVGYNAYEGYQNYKEGDIVETIGNALKGASWMISPGTGILAESLYVTSKGVTEMAVDYFNNKQREKDKNLNTMKMDLITQYPGLVYQKAIAEKISPNEAASTLANEYESKIKTMTYFSDEETARKNMFDYLYKENTQVVNTAQGSLQEVVSKSTPKERYDAYVNLGDKLDSLSKTIDDLNYTYKTNPLFAKNNTQDR